MNHPKANFERTCDKCKHFTAGRFPRCNAGRNLITGEPLPMDVHAARSTRGHCGPAGKRWEAIDARQTPGIVAEPPRRARRNGAATVAALALAIFAAWSPPAARAEHAPAFRSRADCHLEGTCGLRWNRPHYVRYERHRKSYYHYDDSCKSILEREGDQFASEEGAKKEAVKAWQQAVRWRFGEMYMDIKNAADTSYVCSRSSVGEVVGNTLHRCSIRAKPCKPESK